MNTLKTTFLMALMTVLLVVIGQLIGGRTGMLVAFGVATVMNFVAYWSSDKIALSRYKAREVTPGEAPRLFDMVERLAARARIPRPRVYIIPSPTPNAFATGRDPEHAAVAVTEGALELLAEDELEGVIGHELAHVKNRDILISSVAATLAGAIAMLAMFARFAAIFGGRGDGRRGGGLELLAIGIVAPIAAMLIQMAISRSREFLADEGGARFAGTPNGLANALLKLEEWSKRKPMQDASPTTAHMFIVSPLSGGGFTKLFSTHPPTSERVEKLRGMRLG